MMRLTCIATTQPTYTFLNNVDIHKIKEWANAHIASKELNIGYKALNKCLNKGGNATSGGYKWKYNKLK